MKKVLAVAAIAAFLAVVTSDANASVFSRKKHFSYFGKTPYKSYSYNRGSGVGATIGISGALIANPANLPTASNPNQNTQVIKSDASGKPIEWNTVTKDVSGNIVSTSHVRDVAYDATGKLAALTTTTTGKDKKEEIKYATITGGPANPNGSVGAVIGSYVTVIAAPTNLPTASNPNQNAQVIKTDAPVISCIKPTEVTYYSTTYESNGYKTKWEKTYLRTTENSGTTEKLIRTKQDIYTPNDKLILKIAEAYNDNGKVAYHTKIAYNANGTLFGDTAETYNANGRLTLWINKDYDVNGNLNKLTKEIYDANGTPSQKIAETYDANGALVKSTKIAYNSNGQWAQLATYNGSGTLIESIDNTYNANGKLIQKSVKTYDATGKLIETVIYDANGKIVQTAKVKSREYLANNLNVDKDKINIVSSEDVTPKGLCGGIHLLVTLDYNGKKYYVTTSRGVYPPYVKAAEWKNFTSIDHWAPLIAQVKSREYLANSLNVDKDKINIVSSEDVTRKGIIGSSTQLVTLDYNGKKYYVTTSIAMYPDAEWKNFTSIDPADPLIATVAAANQNNSPKAIPTAQQNKVTKETVSNLISLLQESNENSITLPPVGGPQGGIAYDVANPNQGQAGSIAQAK